VGGGVCGMKSKVSCLESKVESPESRITQIDGRYMVESLWEWRNREHEGEIAFHPMECRALQALARMHEARTVPIAAAVEHEKKIGRQYCQVCGVPVARESLLCRAHYPRRVSGLESKVERPPEHVQARD
jgi:hypothetical protein